MKYLITVLALTLFIVPKTSLGEIITLNCTKLDENFTEVRMQFDLKKGRVRQKQNYYGTQITSHWWEITHIDDKYIAWRQPYAFALLDRRTLMYTLDGGEWKYKCSRPL